MNPNVEQFIRIEWISKKHCGFLKVCMRLQCRKRISCSNGYSRPSVRTFTDIFGSDGLFTQGNSAATVLV